MTDQALLLAAGGYGRVGKDTFAELVKEVVRPDVEVRVYKFADRLREECAEIFKEKGLNLDPWTEDPDEKLKVRPWLIDLGAGKRTDDPAYWIKAVRDKFESEGEFKGIRIIADLRYVNEANWILDRKGYPIIISRLGYGPLNEEEKMNTSLLYDTKHPIAYNPRLRRYWWTHELHGESYLQPAVRREREKKNIVEYLHKELEPYLPKGKALKADKAYLEYVSKKGLKLPAIFEK